MRDPASKTKSRTVFPGLWEDAEAVAGRIKWSCFCQGSATLNLKKTAIMVDDIMCPQAWHRPTPGRLPEAWRAQSCPPSKNRLLWPPALVKLRSFAQILKMPGQLHTSLCLERNNQKPMRSPVWGASVGAGLMSKGTQLSVSAVPSAYFESANFFTH